jgi:hypothetical protein
MAIARAAAEKIEVSVERRQFPSFSDIEEQCADEYDELLASLHEDELFEAVDLDRQERIVDELRDALPESKHELVDELVDNQSRHVWLHQEAAFHLGTAVGLRMAQGRRQ